VGEKGAWRECSVSEGKGSLKGKKTMAHRLL